MFENSGKIYIALIFKDRQKGVAFQCYGYEVTANRLEILSEVCIGRYPSSVIIFDVQNQQWRIVATRASRLIAELPHVKTKVFSLYGKEIDSAISHAVPPVPTQEPPRPASPTKSFDVPFIYDDIWFEANT